MSLLLLVPEPLVLLVSSERVNLPNVPLRKRLVSAVPGTCILWTQNAETMNEQLVCWHSALVE